MKRAYSLIAAGALVLATASMASAQLTFSFGNPGLGQGPSITLGQPGYAQPWGGNVGQPWGGNVGQPWGGNVAQPWGGNVAPWTGNVSPWTGYTTGRTTGFNQAYPYAGTGFYSSGYRGYVSPSQPSFRGGYPTFGAGYPSSPYGAYPYGSVPMQYQIYRPGGVRGR